MPTSPEKNPKNIYKENSLTFSPQFGTKRESPVLNPSKSARDINKIISIEIDLKDNKAKIEQNTPNRNLSSSYNNIKLNTTGDTLYIKMKGYEIKEINCCKDDDNAHNIIKNLVARIYFNNLKEDDKKKWRNEAKKFNININKK